MYYHVRFCTDHSSSYLTPSYSSLFDLDSFLVLDVYHSCLVAESPRRTNLYSSLFFARAIPKPDFRPVSRSRAFRPADPHKARHLCRFASVRNTPPPRRAQRFIRSEQALNSDKLGLQTARPPYNFRTPPISRTAPRCVSRTILMRNRMLPAARQNSIPGDRALLPRRKLVDAVVYLARAR